MSGLPPARQIAASSLARMISQPVRDVTIKLCQVLRSRSRIMLVAAVPQTITT